MITVYGHPRSGNNFLAAFVAVNFYPDEDLSVSPALIGHWSQRKQAGISQYGQIIGSHKFLDEQYSHIVKPSLYIYRDGRDVACSIWRTKEFLNKDWAGMSFSEFIRIPLDWHGGPGNRRRSALIIAEHWRSHIEHWSKEDALFVRYEDAVNDQDRLLIRIARFVGADNQVAQHILSPVGWYPRGDTNWRDVFSDGDLTFWNSIVPSGFWGYE